MTSAHAGAIIIGRVYTMENSEILSALSRQKHRLAGLKQVLRALESGKAESVVLAGDADDHIRRRVKVLCQQMGVPCADGPAMAKLGRMCRLQVGTAVACLLKPDGTA